MSTYNPDSSNWKSPPTARTKCGDDSHPDPVPLTNGVRAVTPDPYHENNPGVRRNFGRKYT